jgi:hypothetical protein
VSAPGAAATVVARAATEEPDQLHRSRPADAAGRWQLRELGSDSTHAQGAARSIAVEIRKLITLTFRPLHGESSVLVRGMYFRICADATLRGSDNAIAARYSERLWQLGPRQFRSFECSGPVYLRVTHHDGSRESAGPYNLIKASEGAIFTDNSCLGLYASPGDAAVLATVWHEIALLSSV